jgi:cell division protein FtsB
MAKVGSLKLWLILGAAVIVFLPPFAKYQELKYKNKKLEEKIVALREESRRLEAEKNSLETDINYVEKKARERIGVVRKGEIVIKGTPARKK